MSGGFGLLDVCLIVGRGYSTKGWVAIKEHRVVTIELAAVHLLSIVPKRCHYPTANLLHSPTGLLQVVVWVHERNSTL